MPGCPDLWPQMASRESKTLQGLTFGTLGALSHGGEPLIAHGPINKAEGFTWVSDSPTDEFREKFPDEVATYIAIVMTGKPNYQQARIPVTHALHTDNWLTMLEHYHDQRLLQYIQFGFPLGYTARHPPQQNFRNHALALKYPAQVEAYLHKELSMDSLLGPFKDNPLHTAHMNPIMSHPKKESASRRIILDLSYAPNDASVNAGIQKCALEGEYVRTTLPTPQDLARELLASGPGTYMYMFGLDLARAYRQLRIDPGDWGLMGMQWRGVNDLVPG